MKYEVFGDVIASIEVDVPDRKAATEAWEQFCCDVVDNGTTINNVGVPFELNCASNIAIIAEVDDKELSHDKLAEKVQAKGIEALDWPDHNTIIDLFNIFTGEIHQSGGEDFLRDPDGANWPELADAYAMCKRRLNSRRLPYSPDG